MDFNLVLKYQIDKLLAILGDTSYEHKKLYIFIATVKYWGRRSFYTQSCFDINSDGYPDAYHNSAPPLIILYNKTVECCDSGAHINNNNAFVIDEKIKQVLNTIKRLNNLHQKFMEDR